MGVPLAASPTSPTPGLWLTVDLIPKNVSPGSQPVKACILAPKNASGAIVNNTEIRPVLSLEEIEVAGGEGSLGSLAYARLKAKHPNCQVDYVSPTPSAGAAATGSIQVTGTITANYTGRIKIMGRTIDVPWNVGETASQWHAKAVTYIGRYKRDLFVSASVGTTPDRVLLTANSAGPAGNDVKVSFELLDGAGGTIATVDATLSGGTTEPDFTTALATIAGREYDFIGVCLSNADVVSTSGNFSRLDTHVTGIDEGPAAKLQQGVAGHTLTRTGAAVSSAARNEQQLELINLQNALSLPCEIMGDEIGGRMQGVALKISANRIGEEMLVYGATDPVANDPTTAQSDAALLAGLSIGGYTANGTPKLIRAITTYTATPTGAQVLPTDCNEIDAIYQYAKDLRASLPVEFAGAKVTKDLVEGDEDLPEGVVEERDIKAFIVARTKNFWIPKGVIDGTHFSEQLAGGKLIVKVNATDETQVDIFIPAKPFKNLAKMGVYLAKDG
jgi:phage tail sheath gpL-like